MKVVLQRIPHLNCVTVSCADWDDFTNSDPMTDVDDAREEFVRQTWEPPNRMVVSAGVHYVLMKHPLVIVLELLAAVFDVEEYVVEDVA